MNNRLIITLVALFVLLNTVLFFISKSILSKPKEPVSLTTQAFPTPQENTITLPVALNKNGVQSTKLVYVFTGKVINIKPIGQNSSITLDISDPQTPDFLITKNTFIINKASDSKVPVGDIKVGDDVEVTMTYRLNQKTWDLTAVVILNPTK